MYLTNQSLTNTISIFIILLSICIMIFSCGNEAPEHKQESKNDDLHTAAIPSFLDLEEVQEHYEYYKNTDTTDLEDNFTFLIGSNAVTYAKVISFKLDGIQRDSFFNRLAHYESLVDSNQIDSVRIRIHMAFQQSSALNRRATKANFSPILMLAIDSTDVDSIAYALDNFMSKLDWESFSCTAPDSDKQKEDPCSSKTKDIEINCTKARELARGWDKIEQENIFKQLYLYDCHLPDTGRVKYYTFDANDTKDIHDNYKEIISCPDKEGYFYLHLGMQDSACWVPMRNIIQLDEVDLSTDSLHTPTNSTFFEFSRPCPHYCNNNSSN